MEPAQVAEALGQFTIPQIVALTKHLEEAWGVKAAPVPTYDVRGDEPRVTPDEKTEFDVVLVAIGPNKLNVIKVLRDNTPGMGLKEAKETTEGSLPRVIREGLTRADATELQKKFSDVAAMVEVR